MTTSMDMGKTMPSPERRRPPAEGKERADGKTPEREESAAMFAETGKKELFDAIAAAEKGVVNPVQVPEGPDAKPELVALNAEAAAALAANAERMRDVAGAAAAEAEKAAGDAGMGFAATGAIELGGAATLPGIISPDRIIVLPRADAKDELKERLTQRKTGSIAPRETQEAADADRAIDTALLVGMIDHFPEEAMNGVIAKADTLTFDDKLQVLLPLLEDEPGFASRLDEVKLSPGERLSVAMRLAKREPVSFFMAMREGLVSLSVDEKAAVTADILEREPGLAAIAVKELSLSHETAVDILKQAPPGTRAEMLRSLNVPDAETGKEITAFSPEEMAWFAQWETDKAWIERYEEVEDAKDASRTLMFAIEAAFPHRAEAERARFKAEQQLLGMIERAGELGRADGQATAPLFVQIEGRALPAIYKPRGREQQARTGIPKGEMAGREALASFIDRALQLDIVPPTVLRDGPEGIGTVQDWKVGNAALKDPRWDDASHAEQRMRIGLFDWLTQNSDRHMGNWIISPDGKHHAIDNGALFADRVTKFDGVRSAPLNSVRDMPLTPELRRNVEMLAGSPEVLAALKIGFEATLSERDAKRAWREFSAKLEKARQPDFRLPDTEWWSFN